MLTSDQVKRIHVEQRENPIVNRLNKTKVEKFPDLREEREARRAELRKRDQGALQAKVCMLSSFFHHSTLRFFLSRKLLYVFLLSWSVMSYTISDALYPPSPILIGHPSLSCLKKRYETETNGM